MKSTRGLRHLAVPLLLTLGLAAGFAREVLLAFLFGTSPDIESFRVAYALPAVVSETAAISMTAAMMPLFLYNGTKRGMITSFKAMIPLALLISILGIITMPLQVAVLAPGFDDEITRLTVKLGIICWLMPIFLLLSYPIRASLAARSILWPSSVGPLARNFSFILALVILYSTVAANASVAAVAGLLSSFLVFLVYATIMHWAPKDPGSETSPQGVAGHSSGNPKYVFIALLSTVIIQCLLTGGRMIDRLLASTAHQGGLAAVEYSYSIIMAFGALIGTSANIILLPAISRTLHSKTSLGPRERLILTTTASSAVVIALVGTLTSYPLVRLLLERGAFSSTDSQSTASILQIQFLGFPFLIASLILTQALIIQGRNGTLLLLSLGKLILKLGTFWIATQWIDTLPAIAVSFVATEFMFALFLALAFLHFRHSAIRLPEDDHASLDSAESLSAARQDSRTSKDTPRSTSEENAPGSAE